jgi:hypothetical protein
MGGAIPPISVYALMACTRMHLASYFYKQVLARGNIALIFEASKSHAY